MHLLREGKPGGFPLFFGKGPDCVGKVRIVLWTLSGLFLVDVVNRPGKRKRTNREIPRKNRENPPKSGKDKKRTKWEESRSGKPPPLKISTARLEITVKSRRDLKSQSARRSHIAGPKSIVRPFFSHFVPEARNGACTGQLRSQRKGRKKKGILKKKEGKEGQGGPSPSTAGTFQSKFRKNSGKTPETLSELFLQ